MDCPAWVVDLDGTLVRTDTLLETIVAAAGRCPWQAVLALCAVPLGRQYLKQRMAAIAGLDVARLPYRGELVDLLGHYREAGRHLHLVTAADQSLATAVARHLALFDDAVGSSPQQNLKGPAKARFLAQRFPEGFVYVGDSKADLAVWRVAAGAVLVGPAAGLRAAVEAAGTTVLETLPDRPPTLAHYRRLLRLHQWSKNALLFVPLVLAHALGQPAAVLRVLAAFLAFGLVASATYVLNDLSDLEADRQHATKRARPLASGDVPIGRAVALGLALFAAGMAGCLALSRPFAMAVVAYVALTAAYSMSLKKVPLIDAGVIGCLFSLRLVMGIVVVPVAWSDWLVSFSILFFGSLAFAKRHSELMKAAAAGQAVVPGRHYRAAEWPLTLVFGVGMGVASLVVMLLYIHLEAAQSHLYATPGWLIAAPLATLCWVMRIWLMSHRGELDEDPVEFVFHDRVSWALAMVVGAAIVLAT
jgi:4-hydroxybenzoate polyprenyltransferase/phosphoserine phosphatase